MGPYRNLFRAMEVQPIGQEAHPIGRLACHRRPSPYRDIIGGGHGRLSVELGALPYNGPMRVPWGIGSVARASDDAV